MSNYYNSGLYTDPFFTKHKQINIDGNENIYDEIQYDFDLFSRYHKDSLEYDTEDDLREQLDTLFWEKLSYWTIYFEPIIFNEEIALECGLTPFRIGELCLLALSGCGMDLSPKLDTYQALTDHTIDKYSRLFSDLKYFEAVVGKSLTEGVLKAISYTP